MIKTIKVLSLLLFALSIIVIPEKVQAEASYHQPVYSSGSDLINAVNALRATYGLAPYRTNSILMDIAQVQAEYLVSIGTISHSGPDGSRPYQRALAAGYPVAGDLSLGGWFSENLTAGVGQTAEDAVQRMDGR